MPRCQWQKQRCYRIGRNTEQCETVSYLAGRIALQVKYDFLFTYTRKSLYVSFKLHESKHCDNISDRAAEKAERDYEDLKSRGEI